MTSGASLGSNRPLIDAVLADLKTECPIKVLPVLRKREPFYLGDDLAKFLREQRHDVLPALLGVK